MRCFSIVLREDGNHEVTPGIAFDKEASMLRAAGRDTPVEVEAPAPDGRLTEVMVYPRQVEGIQTEGGPEKARYTDLVEATIVAGIPVINLFGVEKDDGIAIKTIREDNISDRVLVLITFETDEEDFSVENALCNYQLEDFSDLVFFVADNPFVGFSDDETKTALICAMLGSTYLLFQLGDRLFRIVPKWIGGIEISED